MASTYLGNHPSHKYQVVERIDTHKQLTWGDSGKLFACFSSDAESATALANDNILVNLPKLSTEIAGWQAKFINATTTNEVSFQIIAFGQPDGGSSTAEGVDSEKVSWLEMREDESPSSNFLAQTADGGSFASSGDDEIGAMI